MFNWEWRRRTLSMAESALLGNMLQYLRNVTLSSAPDRWHWLFNGSADFSVKSLKQHMQSSNAGQGWQTLLGIIGSQRKFASWHGVLTWTDYPRLWRYLGEIFSFLAIYVRFVGYKTKRQNVSSLGAHLL